MGNTEYAQRCGPQGCTAGSIMLQKKSVLQKKEAETDALSVVSEDLQTTGDDAQSFTNIAESHLQEQNETKLSQRSLLSRRVGSEDSVGHRWSFFKSIGDSLKEGVSAVGDTIKTGAAKAFETIKDTARETVKAAVTAVKLHGPALVGGVLAAATGNPAPLMAAAKACLTDIKKEVKEGAQEMHQEILDARDDIHEAAGDELTNQIDEWKGIVDEEKKKTCDKVTGEAKEVCLRLLKDLDAAGLVATFKTISAMEATAETDVEKIKDIVDPLNSALEDNLNKTVDTYAEGEKQVSIVPMPHSSN